MPFHRLQVTLHRGMVNAVLAHQFGDDLQAQYTGGTVMHVYLGESVADPEAVKAFVRKVCQDYRLPYFTLTPTFSVCPIHGYLKGDRPTCGRCSSKTEVYSRIVGYLRPVDQWNDGKQAEFHRRNVYRIDETHE